MMIRSLARVSQEPRTCIYILINSTFCLQNFCQYDKVMSNPVTVHPVLLTGKIHTEFASQMDIPCTTFEKQRLPDGHKITENVTNWDKIATITGLK